MDEGLPLPPEAIAGPQDPTPTGFPVPSNATSSGASGLSGGESALGALSSPPASINTAPAYQATYTRVFPLYYQQILYGQATQAKLRAEARFPPKSKHGTSAGRAAHAAVLAYLQRPPASASAPGSMGAVDLLSSSDATTEATATAAAAAASRAYAAIGASGIEGLAAPAPAVGTAPTAPPQPADSSAPAPAPSAIDKPPALLPASLDVVVPELPDGAAACIVEAHRQAFMQKYLAHFHERIAAALSQPLKREGDEAQALPKLEPTNKETKWAEAAAAAATDPTLGGVVPLRQQKFRMAAMPPAPLSLTSAGGATAGGTSSSGGMGPSLGGPSQFYTSSGGGGGGATGTSLYSAGMGAGGGGGGVPAYGYMLTPQGYAPVAFMSQPSASIALNPGKPRAPAGSKKKAKLGAQAVAANAYVPATAAPSAVPGTQTTALAASAQPPSVQAPAPASATQAFFATAPFAQQPMAAATSTGGAAANAPAAPAMPSVASIAPPLTATALPPAPAPAVPAFGAPSARTEATVPAPSATAETIPGTLAPPQQQAPAAPAAAAAAAAAAMPAAAAAAAGAQAPSASLDGLDGDGDASAAPEPGEERYADAEDDLDLAMCGDFPLVEVRPRAPPVQRRPQPARQADGPSDAFGEGAEGIDLSLYGPDGTDLTQPPAHLPHVHIHSACSGPLPPPLAELPVGYCSYNELFDKIMRFIRNRMR